MPRRLVMFAILGLLLGPVVVGYAADILDCTQECRDDGPLGCSGDEGCCSCCFHSRTTVPVSWVALPIDPTWSDVGVTTLSLPVPAPRDILHVPKP